jgi:peptidoglycan/xylan/chitin deacetylase (PgdA/CDA1 family)
MELLTRWYNPVSAADIRDWALGRASLPKRPVFVTFDDGYRNNLIHAAPILERYGVPALISVTTGYVGSKRLLWCEELRLRVLHWSKPKLPMPLSQPDIRIADGEKFELADRVRSMCKEMPFRAAIAYLDRLRECPLPSPSDEEVEDLLAFLSWDEVRALSAKGFEIGSHTVEHVILSRCGAAELLVELRESKAAIERETGKDCFAIAYPNGGAKDFNALALSAVRAAGYKLGFTMAGRLNRGLEDPLALARVNVPGHVREEVFSSRLSGLHSLVYRAN